MELGRSVRSSTRADALATINRAVVGQAQRVSDEGIMQAREGME